MQRTSVSIALAFTLVSLVIPACGKEQANPPAATAAVESSKLPDGRGHAPTSVVPGSHEDWCEEHAVPESRCIKCHPELVGGNAKDWCPEHGVPESICTRCNSSLTAGFQQKGDWCKEHELPESQCFKCHPDLKQKFAAAYKEKYSKEPPTGGDH